VKSFSRLNAGVLRFWCFYGMNRFSSSLRRGFVGVVVFFFFFFFVEFGRGIRTITPPPKPDSSFLKSGSLVHDFPILFLSERGTKNFEVSMGLFLVSCVAEVFLWWVYFCICKSVQPVFLFVWLGIKFPKEPPDSGGSPPPQNIV